MFISLNSCNFLQLPRPPADQFCDVLLSSHHTPFTRYNRLSNRFDNRLYHACKHLPGWQPVWQQVVSCKWGFRNHRQWNSRNVHRQHDTWIFPVQQKQNNILGSRCFV